MDEGHLDTERILKEVESNVTRVYRQAAEETEKKLDDYLRRFKVKDQTKREQLRKGEITKAEYDYWRTGQIMIGKRWEEMKNTLAQDLHNANNLARSIVQGYMPEVYAVNHNYATFQVEKESLVDTSYTLYDRQTVERIVKDQPDPLPPPGPRKKAEIAAGKDIKWQRGQIQSTMMQSILQGESIPHIAKRMAKELSVKNRSAAVRYARTAATGAQNAGRVDGYKRAQGMGIELEQEWLATLDMRTRHEHRYLDGQHVPVGEPFKVDGYDIKFPGDPSAPGYLIWNCRCTLVPHLKNLDQSNAPRKSKLGDMSYEEWKKEHKEQEAQTLTSDYTGIGSEFKFNDYMLKNHPETMGSMSYVNKDVETTYNRRFHLQKSVYENDPEYGIKEVNMSEYLKMSWQDQNMSFPDFESYKKYILSKEAQDFAEPGSIMDGLRRYNLGATADGYGKGKGARLAFDHEYGLSDFITSNQDVHYTGDTLYRGVKSNKAGIKELQKVMNNGGSINMRGISSWSTSENVANQFTELSLRGSKTSTPLVFIEEGFHTRNAMPFPYSSRGMLIQSEVIYSGDATFSVLKMEEKEGCWYVYVREN